MDTKIKKFTHNMLIIPIILSIFNSNSLASRKAHVTVNKIGQKYYLKQCSSCHGAGNRGGNINSIRQWKEEFNHNAKILISDHRGEDNTKQIIKYLKSSTFNKQKVELLKFLQEFAYDSDTIPTCY